jgi:predicted dehydrogenase
MHVPWTIMAAEAGKHVLCEKPLAHCTSDALAMGDACSAAGVVLMEAYMTHFHPRDRRIAELARSGRIGEFLFASTSFTGVLDRPDDHRWRPEMGGGALLDVGIYCITPMLEAAAIDPGSTDGVRQALGVARRGALGVDASFAGWLDFGGGRSGSFQCSFEAPERQLLEIVGTAAALSVERAFTPGPDDREISLRNRDGSIELVTTEGADPYLLMVEHFGAVVRGQAAPERTVAESIALQRLVARLASTAAAAPV